MPLTAQAGADRARDLNRSWALKPPVVPGRRWCCNSVHLVIGSIGDSPTTQQPTRAPRCPPPSPMPDSRLRERAGPVLAPGQARRPQPAGTAACLGPGGSYCKRARLPGPQEANYTQISLHWPRSCIGQGLVGGNRGQVGSPLGLVASPC